MWTVWSYIVIKKNFISQNNRSRKIGMRSHKTSSGIHLGDVVAAEQHPVSNAVECLFNRIQGKIMHHHPITFSPRGFHVAENTGTGKRCLNKVRPTRTERNPLPAQRFTCGLPGMLGNQALRNGIGINNINITKPCCACQC